MRKYLILICFLSEFFNSSAQQHNTWYFGVRAGISFNPIGIRPVPYAVAQSVMTASEGCSLICDEDGNILFYTNGKTIYNKTGSVMLNGDDLSGHPSAFQSALVIPLPNSTDQFYVFTADAFENTFANGYRYSIVDMNLDNGKGAVTVKNILLQAPGTERLAAARHSNGIDVWIITNDHNSNIFRSWLLNCTGLQTNPVISNSGIILNQDEYANTGSIKVSPDGKYLCQTHFPDLSDSSKQHFFQLFKFNNTNGTIYDPKKIAIPLTWHYASEFSPDSKLLYLTKATETGEIDQFECTLGDEALITASQVIIPTNQGFCGIQSGPDEKIYLGYYPNKLSVISNPNIKGIGCGFELNKIDLESGFGGLNLPSFVNDIVDPYNNFSFQILDTCSGRLQFNGYTNLAGPVSWLWDFGDGSTSTLQNPQHIFPDIKSFFTVKLKIIPAALCGFIIRAKTISAGGLLVFPNFDAIPNCDSNYVRFENKTTFFPDFTGRYTWDFGDGNSSTEIDPIYSYQNAGNYTVKLKITNIPSCLNDSVTRILNIEKLNIIASSDQVIDEGETVQLIVSGGGTVFNWQPSTWLNSSTISNPKATPLDNVSYIVTARNEANCTDIDTVNIKINFKSHIFIPSAFTPNNDGLNDILNPYLSNQYKLQSFSIYNRWGQIVFTTGSYGKGWNGKKNNVIQPAGVYIWMIKATDRNGEMVIRKGTIILIR